MRRCALVVMVVATSGCGNSPGADVDAGSDGPRADAGAADARPQDGPRSDAQPPSEGVPDFIKAAPAGEWTSIGTNTLRDVGFDYAANPPPDGFRTSLQGIMDAWSGGAYDPVKHRLYVNGGGHRDYDGSEWYAFDLAANRWERINDPTLKLESSATDGVFAEGAPIPIHTYDAIVYVPTNDSLYRMARGGSPLHNIWQLSLDTRAWRDTGAPVSDPHSSVAVYVAASQKVCLLETDAQASGYGTIQEFDPSTDTKTRKGWAPLMRGKTGTVDPVAGELVIAGGGETIRTSLTTYESTTIPATGDLRAQETPSPGFVYDARRDRFVAWGAGESNELFFLDKTTWAWTSKAPGGGTPSPRNENGVYGRFQYDEVFDVFIVTTRVSDPVWMYKPADWQK